MCSPVRGGSPVGNRSPRRPIQVHRLSLFLGLLVQAELSAAAFSTITRPHQQATLSPTTPGRVARILAQEGTSVTNGQPLIELDRRQEELEVARRRLVLESEAERKAAKARVETFHRDLEGTRSLYESTKSVSREELDRKQLEVDLSEAELMKVEIGKQREQIEYEMALEALARRWITSPLNGTVTELYIQEGEGCEPRQPLITVVDASAIECVANIPAEALAAFHVGQSVDLDMGVAGGTQQRVGKVTYVAPVVDGGSGLGTLIVIVANTDGEILPGVNATIRSPAATGTAP